jgi:thymidine phosphorylase
LASRQKADDAIDYAVGFSEIEKVGKHVDVDEPLLFVHARNEPSLHSFCRCSKTPSR